MPSGGKFAARQVLSAYLISGQTPLSWRSCLALSARAVLAAPVVAARHVIGHVALVRPTWRRCPGVPARRKNRKR